MNSIVADFQKYISTVETALATRDQRISELEIALNRLLANVEQFGFEHISIEHELADGVKLARNALRRVTLCDSE